VITLIVITFVTFRCQVLRAAGTPSLLQNVDFPSASRAP